MHTKSSTFVHAHDVLDADDFTHGRLLMQDGGDVVSHLLLVICTKEDGLIEYKRPFGVGMIACMETGCLLPW